MSCPTCLDPAEYQGHDRSKHFLTLLGPIRVPSRPYYHCPRCRAGHFPGDATLGLEHTGQTPGVQEILALAGTLDSFAVARRILRKMTGLRVGESTVERTTEAAGDRLGHRLNRGDTFGPPTRWPWHVDATGQTCAYLSLDATGVGQQGPGGGAAAGRMVYVAMVYNPLPPVPDDSRGPRPPRPHAVTQARYLTGLSPLEGLGTQWHRQAHQVGIAAAQRLLALTDGGQGLEDLIQRHFPEAKVILDFWHAAEHLFALAKAYQGPDAEAGRRLGEQWCHDLKHQGGMALLQTLETLDVDGHPAATREIHRQVTQYLRHNVHRMDYPTYQAQGWQIGSGSVESACKTVINARLNGTGMRWGESGSDAVSHLRALLLSDEGQWDAFWAPSRN